MNQVISNTYSKASRHMAVIVTVLMFLPSFNFYINNILRSSGSGSVGTLMYAVLLVTEVYGLYLATKTHLVNKRAAAIAVLAAVLALFSYIIYREELGERLVRNDYHLYYSELLFLFFFGLPALLLSSACHCWDIVYNYATKVAPVIVAMAIYAWWLVGFSTWGNESINYMTLSYNVMTAGCVCLAQSAKGFHPVYWASSLIFLFIIVAAGCRGALVCTIFFIAVVIYRQATSAKNKGTIRTWRIIGLTLLLFLPRTFHRLFNDVGSLFDQVGIVSRTMEAISDDSFFQSSSRDNIRTAIMKGVWENPFGYGLYGDRYACVKHYMNGSEYAHNIFFEFLADFGVIIGPGLLLLIIMATYKLFKKYRTTDTGLILLIIIPDGFLKLFFSNSYLMDTAFFILMGFIITTTAQNKRLLIGTYKQ